MISKDVGSFQLQTTENLTDHQNYKAIMQQSNFSFELW